MAANFESWFNSAYVNHPSDGAFACHLRAAWDAAVENGSSHNTASAPVVKCSCGNEAEVFMCDDCYKNEH